MFAQCEKVENTEKNRRKGEEGTAEQGVGMGKPITKTSEPQSVHHSHHITEKKPQGRALRGLTV